MLAAPRRGGELRERSRIGGVGGRAATRPVLCHQASNRKLKNGDANNVAKIFFHSVWVLTLRMSVRLNRNLVQCEVKPYNGGKCP